MTMQISQLVAFEHAPQGQWPLPPRLAFVLGLPSLAIREVVTAEKAMQGALKRILHRMRQPEQAAAGALQGREQVRPGQRSWRHWRSRLTSGAPCLLCPLYFQLGLLLICLHGML